VRGQTMGSEYFDLEKKKRKRIFVDERLEKRRREEN
jgi:hypothetical protein